MYKQKCWKLKKNNPTTDGQTAVFENMYVVEVEQGHHLIICQVQCPANDDDIKKPSQLLQYRVNVMSHLDPGVKRVIMIVMNSRTAQRLTAYTAHSV